MITMHLFFLTRGIKHEVDEFIKQLSCQYLPYKFRQEGKSELQNGALQVRVSPIQLWDVSFPVTSKDAMLTTLFGTDMANAGKPINKKHEKIAWALRKGLGVKKIPDQWDTKEKLAPQPKHMEVVAIGEKEDYYINDQEMI